MSLFAVADLHLPGGQEKPMQVFGAQWEDHFRHIAESWQAQVQPEDTVLIPGDISWAMTLEEAMPGLRAIGSEAFKYCNRLTLALPDGQVRTGREKNKSWDWRGDKWVHFPGVNWSNGKMTIG